MFKSLMQALGLVAAAIIFTAIVTLLVPANAQALPKPLPACVTRPPLPVPTTATAPTGLPEAFGGQCKVLLEANRVGGAAAMWCGQDLHLYAVRWSAVTPLMLADFAMLGLPGDNRERIRAMQQRHQTSHVLDMCDVWGPMRERINAAMPPPPPPPPVEQWRTPTLGTGSLFKFANGQRVSVIQGRRAPANVPCDCSVKATAQSITYCALANGPRDEVTACRLVAP